MYVLLVVWLANIRPEMSETSEVKERASEEEEEVNLGRVE
jgi:hypothetical protein